MGLAFRIRICILRFMDTRQVIQRLRSDNRAAVSRETGINRTYLDRLVWGHIKDPGASKIERLSRHYEARDAGAAP